ncbi:protein arginine N-methyltransferase, putative [Theileria equi strain WA]|uniref:type I protein arginine methyltransferase n=1 Tax=Theileria equi strain WA TaxID=1537102 RepID=L0ATK3_THEEQ|nr:protein arginine N-methyltransferase, putative [Theileria equi strain WA]AFZ78972.1 protein arginine N-methyltransferase, putative [Theileria equi strain WA]|eukprot:XP_004828638.1 protein arginine N-methyltransferase, putative [Theileria equi strain WA]
MCANLQGSDADVLSSFFEEWPKFDAQVGQSSYPQKTEKDVYFSSYEYIGIHEEMIKDSVRTGNSDISVLYKYFTGLYYKAIIDNQELFKDKVVMDVGCGTGILSMFCAKAGAKRVYAIDYSNIIQLAKNITKTNGFSDKIIYIQNKVEDVQEITEKVDIIVSEWMGYFLLYENMLASVLYARDKWLKSGGLIFPDKARLFIAGIEDAEFKSEKFDGWEATYGLDFSLMKNHLIEEALVDVVDEKSITTNAFCILDLDLMTCVPDDTDFCSSFSLVAQRKDYVHAFVFWFDVTFRACKKPLTLTTSPRSKYTHWKQTVFYIEDNIAVNINDEISGMIAVRKNSKNPRDVDVKIGYQLNGSSSILAYK